MARKKLTPEQDAELQEPVINAIATYFDNVYEEGSVHGSVGTVADFNDGTCLMYSAFRVPIQLREVMQLFLTHQETELGKRLATHVVGRQQS